MSDEQPDAAAVDATFFAGDQNLIGRDFGHYRVTGELGKGGMATVYKADEQSLNRIVALKVMSPKISEDPTMIKRFQREAQAAAQLNHPNIVHIYTIGEEKGVHYFTMEYIKGKTLGQLRRERGALTAAELIPIMTQTAEALGEAHKHNMVHRDIKPSNIMVDSANRVKVTDFGIAHVASATTQLTVEGSFLGTPQYMSPEQCEGKKIDGRSDIYSLGVTFYELLSGRIPFEADTPGSMLIKIVKGDLTPLRQAAPNVAPAVRSVVERMMQRNPNKRYQNTDEVIQAFKRIQTFAGEETKATAFGKTMATVATAARKPGGKWIYPAIAAAAILLLVGAGAAVYFLVGSRAKPQTASKPPAAVLPAPEAAVEKEVSAADETAASVEKMAATVEKMAELLTQQAAKPVVQESVEKGPAAIAPAAASLVAPAPTPLPVAPAIPPAPVVERVPPPENSLVVSTSGDEQRAPLLAGYAQHFLGGTKFKIVNVPLGTDSAPEDIAEFQLTVEVANLGSTELKYMGRTSDMQNASVTMRLIRTDTGELVLGPFMQQVQYTALNAEKKFQETMRKLSLELRQAAE